MRIFRSITSRGRRGLAPLLVTAFLAARGHAADVFPAPSSDAQRLVFLLEYVGTDYDGAVRAGQVVNQIEYGELLRFTKQLIEGYRARQERSEAVTTGLTRFQELIRERAPGEEVWAASRRLLPPLARSLGVSVRPQTLPNLANGRRLWSSDCAPCHGPTGAGDGPAASDMKPPPTAFLHDTLEQLSPRQAFNALTFGIDGTAMPSFTPAYTDEERWDVAFFLMTLRPDFEPKRPRQEPGLSLDELAAHANVELLSRLRQRWPDATLGEVDWLRSNLAAALAPTAALAGSEAASGGLAVALQLQDAFARVADHVLPRVVGVTGYVRDAAWSPARLQAERGDAWMVANPDALRYPGFRPLRSGSGLLGDDGYVISCNHLVRDDRNEVVQIVDVELSNQAHVPGGVVGSEPTLDLAILRFAPLTTYDALPELQFGDSDTLQVGHWLIALGDPPGPQKIFAVGVVSGPPERQCYQEQRSATLLQSSLVVPAGGLGGPVVDIFGHVVGLNIGQANPTGSAPASDTALAARTLPINLVLNLFEALKVAQSQRSPWLGISVLELPLIRRRLGPAARKTVFPRTGVYIDDVFDPSPASRAGVRPGDFLVGLGGHQLFSVADFQTWLYVLGIGTQAELELMRDGQSLRVVAPIEIRPESASMR